MVGYVMFYIRSPQQGAQDHIAAALSILWMVSLIITDLSNKTWDIKYYKILYYKITGNLWSLSSIN